jgi:L-xylulokinase
MARAAAGSTTKKPHLLGLDNGGTVTKAAIYDLEGREIAVSSIKTEILFPHPGHVEKDMERLWEANVRVIAESLRKAKIHAGQIVGIGITGHGNGLYLIDEKGRPVGSGINSADSRAADYVRQWYRDDSFRRVLPKTCQSIWAGQPAALLAWFRDREPQQLERARWILMCKDYVRFRLTGEVWAELTDYSGTSLVNVREVGYDPEILEAFGISGVREKLPPLRRSEELCGCVSEAAEAQTGLKAGTPVAGGMFDIDACAVATGIVDPEKLCMVAGSWSINEYISPSPVESDDLFMTCLYCIPGYWLIMEGSPTSASNLEWFVSELMGGDARECGASGKSVFDLCGELVARIPADQSEVVFLPFLYGSNVGPGASACFLGLHGWHNRAHLLRAIYEGVAFSHKSHVDRLLRLRPPPRAARISGGVAHSPVWVQMFADCLQLPIEVPETREPGTLGAALSAGVGTKQFASWEEAVARMVHVSHEVEPNSRVAEIYQEKYDRYCRSGEALQTLWAEAGG